MHDLILFKGACKKQANPVLESELFGGSTIWFTNEKSHCSYMQHYKFAVMVDLEESIPGLQFQSSLISTLLFKLPEVLKQSDFVIKRVSMSDFHQKMDDLSFLDVYGIEQFLEIERKYYLFEVLQKINTILNSSYFNFKIESENVLNEATSPKSTECTESEKPSSNQEGDQAKPALVEDAMIDNDGEPKEEELNKEEPMKLDYKKEEPKKEELNKGNPNNEELNKGDPNNEEPNKGDPNNEELNKGDPNNEELTKEETMKIVSKKEVSKKEVPKKEELNEDDPNNVELNKEETMKLEVPKKEEPKKEEPKKEEPTKEEPTKEEPMKEEPKTEEPRSEEPHKDEPSEKSNEEGSCS